MRRLKQHRAWAEVLASVDTRCSLTCQNTKPHSCIGWGPRSFRAAAAGGGQGPSVRRPCNNKVTTWDAYSTELVVEQTAENRHGERKCRKSGTRPTSLTLHIPVSTMCGHLTLRTYGANRTKSRLTLLFSHAELHFTNFFICSERKLYIPLTKTKCRTTLQATLQLTVCWPWRRFPPLRVEAHVHILLRSVSDHRITVALECPPWWE